MYVSKGRTVRFLIRIDLNGSLVVPTNRCASERRVSGGTQRVHKLLNLKYFMKRMQRNPKEIFSVAIL
jgi:hypothetical protein